MHKFKRLNTLGFAHHAIIMLLVVISVASFGAYTVYKSNAQTVNSGTRPPSEPTTSTTTPNSPSQPAQTAQADCGSLKRHNGSTSSTCGSCYSAFVDTTPNTQNDACVRSVEPDCSSAAHEFYNASENKCGCVTGYHRVTSNNTCQPNSTTTPPPATSGGGSTSAACPTGQVRINGACENQVSCNGANTQYDSSRNTCVCRSGYTRVNGDCVYDRTASTPTCARGQVVVNGHCENKVTCTAANTEYKAETNQCVCKNGYSRVDGDCVSRTTTAPPTCARGQVVVNNQCQDKVSCNPRTSTYRESTNTCVCNTGYVRSGDQCVQNTAGNCPEGQKCLTPAQVKATCDAQFLQYDKSANKCKEGCKAGYVKKEGKCVDQAEAQNTMTERLCRALGRDWVPGREASARPTTGTSAAYCSESCIDTDGSEFVPTGNILTSYCKATVTGSLGASPDISPTDCAVQHRIYITAAQVCSARCTTGYYLKDSGCLPLASNTGENDNGDGDSPDGGCLGGAQPETDGTCPEDTETNPIANPEVKGIDTNIDKEACKQLGREWESGTKDVNGKKIKGCSVDQCIKNGDKIIKQENGKPFCKGYIAKIDKEKCNELHRVWVAEAKGCSVGLNQDKKAGTTVEKADQCVEPYTTYVYKDNGADECLKPSTVGKLKGLAKSTGTPFVKLTNMSKAGICNVKPHKHWNGDKCIPDATGEHTTGQGNSGGNGGETSGTPNPSPAPPTSPISTKSGCEGSPYNRIWKNGKCDASCRPGFSLIKKHPYSVCEDREGHASIPNSPTCPRGTHPADTTSTTHCVSDSVAGYTQANPIHGTCSDLHEILSAYFCPAEISSHNPTGCGTASLTTKTLHSATRDLWIRATACHA